MDASQKERRIAALTRLAIATREKVDKATYVLYVEQTSNVPVSVLEAACRRLETSSDWFPKLSQVLEECRIVGQRRAEQAAQKRLPPPELTEAQKADILSKFRAVLEKKVMR